jgi:pseudouridine-5'-phosphate glycosidase
MPFPHNVRTALAAEAIVRKHGATPATIGCLGGRLLVGMTLGEIKSLGTAQPVNKISRRDLAVVPSRRLTGGTTVAGTMVLAHMVGIKVFATGVSTPQLLILGAGRGTSRGRIMYIRLHC